MDIFKTNQSKPLILMCVLMSLVLISCKNPLGQTDSRDADFSPGGGGSSGGSMNPVDTTPPDPPSALSLSSRWVTGVLPSFSPILSWVVPSEDFDQSLVALGATIGGQEVVPFLVSDTDTNHVFRNLNLNQCGVTYYPSVKVVDENRNESAVVSDTIGFRYDNTNPLPVGSVDIVGFDGSYTQTVTVDWSAQAGSDNCGISHYQIAVGYDAATNGLESSDLNNVIDWTDVPGGALTSQYQIQDGVDGFSFNSVLDREYFFSIRVVDEAGLISNTTTSNGWYTFHPSQIPNLSVWLDSSDPSQLFQNSTCTTPASSVTNPVGCWRDKSGQNNHALQATAGFRPLIGVNAVDFDGVDDFLGVSTKNYTNASNLSIVSLFQAEVQSTNAASCCRPLVSFTTNSPGLYPWVGLTRGNLVPFNNLFHGWNGVGLAYTPTVAGERIMVSATHDGTNALWNAYSFGVQQVTDYSIVNYTATQLNIAGDSSNASRRLHGEVFEVVIVDRVITTLEREKLEGYIACKYATRDQLDSTHPYYDLVGANQAGCP